MARASIIKMKNVTLVISDPFTGDAALVMSELLMYHKDAAGQSIFPIREGLKT